MAAQLTALACGMATLAFSQILETKVHKLEQLVRLKDAKIAALLSKLQL
jgi:hypothetical protein